MHQGNLQRKIVKEKLREFISCNHAYKFLDMRNVRLLLTQSENKKRNQEGKESPQILFCLNIFATRKLKLWKNFLKYSHLGPQMTLFLFMDTLGRVESLAETLQEDEWIYTEFLPSMIKEEFPLFTQ